MLFNLNPFGRISKVLSMIALMAVAISCSKDDEPEPKLEEAALSLSETTQVIEVPQALLESEDSHALMAADWISMANSMSGSLALFTPPAGAVQSNEVITPLNGRSAATRAVVYTWSDQQQYSVAYQIQEVSDKYIFELFYKDVDDAGWYRYLYAEEMKDRSAGHMAMYDVWGSDTETRDEELFYWEWSRQKENFSMTVSAGQRGARVTIDVNTKTHAGEIAIYDDTVKTYEMTWTAQGSGTWKQFDSTGAVVEEGEWS